MDQRAADEVIALEKQLHDPDVRRSRDQVDQLLADSFVEIASSGKLYTRSEIIDDLAYEELRHIEAADFVAMQSGTSVIGLTYKTSTRSGSALRESIWMHTGDGWQILFHRGARVL